MGGALLSGLLQGFSEVGLKKQDQQHQDKMQAKKDRLAVLLNIDPISLDDSGRKTLAGLLDDIYTGGNGKGGNGKGGKPGPYTSLFEKIGHLMTGDGKRPDKLANVVPQGAQPQTAAAQPQGAQPQAAQPGMQPGAQPAGQPMQEHLGLPAGAHHQWPTQLEAVPNPNAAPASVPQNVPRGTIHPDGTGAGPMSLGQLWASQDPNRAEQAAMDARQARLDRFRKDWEAKNGPLTPEQQNELMEVAAGIPAGFGRAGKPDKLVAAGVIGPDGQPSDLMQNEQTGEKYFIHKYEKPPATPKPTAIEQKNEQEIQDRMAATGETRAVATQHVQVAAYTDRIQTRLTARYRGEIAEDTVKQITQRLASGNPTVKDARYVLKDALAEAKERVRAALIAAKGAWIETDGTPGPDNGKTEEQIANEILEGQGFNADELRKLAAGSVPQSSKPKGQSKAPTGGSATNPLGIPGIE